MNALVGAFNQEKALVGAFSVIVQLHRWIVSQHYLRQFHAGMLRSRAKTVRYCGLSQHCPEISGHLGQWPVASHTAGPGSTCRPLIPLTNTRTTVRKQTQTRCANNIYRVGSKTSINNRCCKSWCNLVNIVSSYQCIFYREQQKWQQHCAVLWPQN